MRKVLEIEQRKERLTESHGELQMKDVWACEFFPTNITEEKIEQKRVRGRPRLSYLG